MTRQIIDLQRRLMEAGRIRIGHQVAVGTSGKTRPARLDTFRLTSADKRRIDLAAQIYGGQPQQWQSPAGPQWEVFTETATLDIIVPPGEMAFSQAYEIWQAGGIVRRCDGRMESLSEGPCLCDPDNRECDIHTRLSVMLRDLPGLGVWRIDSSGYYAAVELSGAVEIIGMAAGRGQMLPARLRLEQRSVKRQINGKPETRRFPVPVLDIDIAPGQLVLGTSPDLELGQAESPAIALHSTDAVPRKTIAEQIEEDDREMARARQRQPTELPASAPAQRPSRRAPAIPATGRKPRTVAQAAAQTTQTVVDDKPSQQQMRHMFALLKEQNLDSRETSLDFVHRTTGRRVESRNELTSAEVSQIINALTDMNLAAIDIDPDTGEEVPALDQPTLNGDK